ncbi:MAG: hypothetical protein WCA07_05865 [Gloeobacterales cyanobacterium]
MAVLTRSQEKLKPYEEAILEVLRRSNNGLSMDDIDYSLKLKGLDTEQSAKEAIWSLVDRGNASFDDSWRLILGKDV